MTKKSLALSSISGLKVVLTGKFKTMKRKEAQAACEAAGADVTSAVSGKTQLLVLGTGGGSKLAKAEKLGVPIISEAELLVLLGREVPEDAPSTPAKATAQKSAAKRTTQKAPPKTEKKKEYKTVLKALIKAAKDYNEERIQKQLKKLKEDRADFLWEHVTNKELKQSRAFLEATAKHIADVPVDVVTSTLTKLSRSSLVYYLPKVGLDAVYLLTFADLSDEGELRAMEPNLPEAHRWMYWTARGRKKVGDPKQDVPADVREAVLKALPKHATQDKLHQQRLGGIIAWFAITSAESSADILAALMSSSCPVPIPALGWPIFRVPASEFAPLGERLDVTLLDSRYLTWWLDARRRTFPDETLDQTREVFEYCVRAWRKLKKNEKNWRAKTIEHGALHLAKLYQASGEPVPEALFDVFSEHTTELGPWTPLFESLSQERQARLLEQLSELLPSRYQTQLAPLRSFVEGQEGMKRLITDLEESIRKSTSVYTEDLFKPVGKVGPRIAPLLADRIDELTDALDPNAGPASDGYKPRRVVIALRNALGVALAIGPDDALLERYDKYFRPAPETLFKGNDDFPYCFFTGLSPAKAFFGRLPDARARGFIDAWRSSRASAYMEERLKMAFPDYRHAILSGGATLSEEIEAVAKETGLACDQPVYLIARAKDGQETSALNRLSASPIDGPEDYDAVFTLDLNDIPELKPRYTGARAITLFVDKPDDGFEDSIVVPINEEDARPMNAGQPFTIERAMVPVEVFGETKTDPLRVLRQLLRQSPARALGYPFYIQEDQGGGGFVLEAGEAFVDLNLGDSGKLYVFTSEAFWQCH